jgi:hypothetical protein
MAELEMLSQTVSAVSLSRFLIDMMLCAVASFVLRRVYISYSLSLSGKFHIGTVIPLLSLVTFLVIMVVKSSLALSLGLVGALSVVRFRTPIKEPEELVYLFLAIALGLGYGANQTLVTSIAFILILAVIVTWLSRKPREKKENLEFNCQVEWRDTNVSSSSLIAILAKGGEGVELLKYFSGSEETSLSLKVVVDSFDDMEALVKKMRDLDQSLNVVWYESRPLQ